MALIGLSAVLCGIVGIATGWTNRSSKPGQRFCHLQTRPDRLWDTRSVSYRGSSPVGGWGRRPERDVVHSFLSNADVDTECKQTSAPLLCLRSVDSDDFLLTCMKMRLTLVIPTEVLTGDVFEACDAVDNRET